MSADAAILELPKVFLQAKQLLPEYSGIYYVLDEANTVWYIGQAKNIRKRWQGKAHHRIYQLEAQKKKHFSIYYEQVSVSQLDQVEKERIEKYHPHLNDSPVKTKKVRPAETLLRETLAAIADFSFILGVEPQNNEIRLCLDLAAFREKFTPESLDEERAIRKTAFTSRKTYARQWEGFSSRFSCRLNLMVNGSTIKVNYWSNWFSNQEPLGFREYISTTLAQESIRALTPESLAKLQQQSNQKDYLQRLIPYTSDLIKVFFDESIDRDSAKGALFKVSEDYKTGRRGIGSRSKLISSKTISIEELFISRGIDLNKYSRSEVRHLSRGDRMGVYIQCFSVDLKKPRLATVNKNIQVPAYTPVYGILNDQEIVATPPQFDTVYLLAGVEKKGWLLVEEYLKNFAQAATKLNNGEGYIEKFYVSPRKFIVSAKVNIKLETIGSSFWIPFGKTEEFPTFETATEEICRRLKESDLPGLKVGFKRETIEK